MTSGKLHFNLWSWRDAYGWPHDLSDEQILEKLVELNAERAAEEARGVVRWLRPEFQNPAGDTQKKQKTIAIPEEEKAAQKAIAKAGKLVKQPWPKANEMAARFSAMRAVMEQTPVPMSSDEVAKHFKGARKKDIASLLETLVNTGNIRELDDGRFVK